MAQFNNLMNFDESVIAKKADDISVNSTGFFRNKKQKDADYTQENDFESSVSSFEQENGPANAASSNLIQITNNETASPSKIQEESKVRGILAMGADLVIKGAKQAVKFFVDTQIEAEVIEFRQGFVSAVNDQKTPYQEEDTLADEYASKFKVSVEAMRARRDMPISRARFRTDKRTKFTEYMILDSLWVGHGFAIFLTLDNRTSQAYLELYFNDERHGKIFGYPPKQLFKANRKSVECKMVVDCTKRFAAFMFWDFEGSQKSAPILYVVDCTALRQLPMDEGQTAQSVDIINHAVRMVADTSLLNEDFVKCERLFLEFLYTDPLSLVPNLQILIQKRKSPYNKQFKLRTALLFGCKSQSKCKTLLRSCNRNKDFLPGIKIVGMHLISKSEIIYVYENGVIEQFMDKLIRNRVKPPFVISCSLITEVELGHLALLQSESGELWGVLQGSDRSWTVKFMTQIEDTLIGAYRNILIGVSKEKDLKLIELGWSRKGVKFPATECKLVEQSNKHIFRFDRDEFSFFIHFERGSNNFLWGQIEQTRYILNAHDYYASQICDGFLVRINRRRDLLEIFQCGQDSYLQHGQPEKTIKLPQNLSFKWFLPIMSPSSRSLLLQLSNSDRKSGSDFNQFHTLVFVDLQSETAYPQSQLDEDQQVSYSFVDDRKLIRQTIKRITEQTVFTNDVSFWFDEGQTILLEGNSKEKNIFAVTDSSVVLAFHEINQGIYGCQLDSQTEFIQLCYFNYPRATLDKKKSYDACLVPQQNRILLMVALQEVMYLQQFLLDQRPKLAEGAVKEVTAGSQDPIPIKKARAICTLNESQIVVQSFNEIVVLDWVKRTKDVSIKLHQNFLSQVTAWNGWVSLNRESSNLIHIGFPRDAELAGIQSFNDLKIALLGAYETKTGYISIDEQHAKWHDAKTFAVQVMQDDVMTPDGTKFTEHPFVEFHYKIDYNVWEYFIDRGIRKGDVVLDHEQLDRVFNPVISQNNDNMLYTLAKNRMEKLREVFNLLHLKQHYFHRKRCPFYLNFEGKSALNVAIESRDFASFNLLLEQLVHWQNWPESSIIVDSWLSDAMERGIELDMLFRSQILTQEINPDSSIFVHYKQFPMKHPDKRTYIVEYPNAFVKLANDNKAYQTLFAPIFGQEMSHDDERSELTFDLARKSTLVSSRKIKSVDKLYPIQYIVDHVLTSSQDQRDDLLKLLGVLAETEEMSYFRSGYIQRLLTYHWENTTQFQFILIFSFNLISYLLILANAILVQYDKNQDQILSFTKKRVWILAANSIIIFPTQTYLQIRLIINERSGYFRKTQNWNELMFTALFVVTSIMDIIRLAELTKYPLDDLPEVLEAYRNDDFQNWFRIMYALLVISGAWRMLNYAQIINYMSFMIKMLQRVSIELIPFIVLFCLALGMFGFVFLCLNLQFGDDYEHMRSQSVMPMLFWLIRTSMGDFDVSTFQLMNPTLLVALWIAWVLLVILNMLIFLNFLIAVISDVYARIMETRTEEQFQKMAEVILQLDLTFSNFRSMQLGQTRLTVTRQVMQDSQSDMAKQGFLQHMKQLMQLNQSQLEKLDLKLVKGQNEILRQQKEHARLIEEDSKQIQQLAESVKQLQRSLDRLNLMEERRLTNESLRISNLPQGMVKETSVNADTRTQVISKYTVFE